MKLLCAIQVDSRSLFFWMSDQVRHDGELWTVRLQNDQAKKDKLLMSKIQAKGFPFLFEKKRVLFRRSMEISGEWYG